jgi:hypothetical protein
MGDLQWVTGERQEIRSASKWRASRNRTYACGSSKAILIRTIWSVEGYRLTRQIGAIKLGELVDCR